MIKKKRTYIGLEGRGMTGFFMKEKKKKEWQVAWTILNSKGKMDFSQSKELIVMIIIKEKTKTNDK